MVYYFMALLRFEYFISEGLVKKGKRKDKKLAEVRINLAKVANDFIKDKQAIIDISKRLQEYQNEN